MLVTLQLNLTALGMGRCAYHKGENSHCFREGQLGFYSFLNISVGQNNTIIIPYQFNVLIYLGKSAMVPTIVGAGKMSLNRFHLGGFIKKM